MTESEQRSTGGDEARRVTDHAAGVITRVEELSYELRIAQVMSRKLKLATPRMRMSEVVELFRTERISGAPVVSESKLVGVISIEDIIRALRQGNLDEPVEQYMSTRLITVRATDPVVEALKIFSNQNVGRLPVVDEQETLIGILTKGDITDGVLRALQTDYQVEEIRRYRASHLFEDIISDRTSLILRYRIKARDFTNGGTASGHIKRALLRLGANQQIARRCGIAIYEAEINLIIHTTHGGTIQVEIEPDKINIDVVDQGPGIPDVEQARKAGYSTAPDEIRELGFGAGMGLVNIDRCVDEMTLESTMGIGTWLNMKIKLPPPETGAPARP